MLSTLARFPFFYVGILLLVFFGSVHVLFLLLISLNLFGGLVASDRILVFEAVLVFVAIGLIAIDIGLMLPSKRRVNRGPSPIDPGRITVALTAYNDESSIGPAVRDFLGHPSVARVIVVSNNSKDRTEDEARAAGALVYNEPAPGYGRCVYRCLQEALAYEDTSVIALCEGDMTFRADDLDKFQSYIRHADIVNGTRIVEQLRAYDTQLSSFMYYGNFVMGKLLEVKNLGRGTFTDAGTTYKMIRRDQLSRLLPLLDPAVNLEFNLHFLDIALSYGFLLVECPVTFHARWGQSKGGNVNNWRATKVGLRMLLGLTFGWSFLSQANPPVKSA